MDALPPVKDWVALAAEEAKILTPYLRRGLKLFGVAYVYAILASLKDALDQTRGDVLGGSSLKFFDEAGNLVGQTKDAVFKLEQRLRSSASGLLRMDDLQPPPEKKP